MKYKDLPEMYNIARAIHNKPCIDTVLLLFLGTDRQEYAVKYYFKYFQRRNDKTDLVLMCMYIRNNSYSPAFKIDTP